MLDCLLFALVACSVGYQPPPFQVDGIRLEPSIETLPSQVTGDGASTLIVRRTAGRIRCLESVTDFATDEDTVAVSSGHAYQVNDTGTKLASGNAVWFTAVALQHRPAGAVEIVYVPGAVAAVADSVVPTQAQIKARLDPENANVLYVIIGDVRFYRSADTSVVVSISELRRPAWVYEANKTGVVFAQNSNTSLASRFLGYMDIPIELISTSAVADGGTYIDGIELPNTQFGGYVKNWSYFPTKAGVGLQPSCIKTQTHMGLFEGHMATSGERADQHQTPQPKVLYKAAQGQHEAGERGQLLLVAAKHLRHLRHHIGQQEQHDDQGHHAHDGGVQASSQQLAAQVLLLLQIVGQAFKHKA